MLQETRSFFRRLLPLAISQFFTSFNSTAFLMLAMYILFRDIEGGQFSNLVLLAMVALCLIPIFVFMVPSGFLSDRLAKRYVLILSKLMEFIIFLGFAGTVKHCQDNAIVPLTVILLLLAVQHTFFRTALNGVLPEIFHEKELSRANGAICMLRIIGILCGAIAVPVMLIRFCSTPYFVMIGMAAFSLVSFFAGFYVTRIVSVVQLDRTLAYPFRNTFSRGWHELARTPGLLLAALGIATFTAVCFSVLFLIGLYAQFTLKGLNEIEVGILRFAPVLGLAVGCLLAGRICSRKIDLGIVPFGAAIVAIFLLIGTYNPGTASILQLQVTGIALNISVYWTPLLCFFVTGIGGSLFWIPLLAFFQQRVSPQARGGSQAALQVLTYAMVIVINAVIVLLSGGILKNAPNMPGRLCRFFQHFPAISPKLIILVLCLLVIVVTLVALCKLPDFALRFLMGTLGKIFYRIRSTGESVIPERGPALLIANHTSFMDAVLISSCTSRPIRFLMQEEIFDKPYLNLLVRFTGFIKVPSIGKINATIKMFGEIQDALRNGDIVCVFPEGAPSKTGIVGKFAGGIDRMLPKDKEVPIIPVSVGHMFGSLFSYFKGPIHLHMPKEFPYFATIAFGKPIPRDTTAFEMRQAVTELAAEDAMQEVPHEHPVHYLLGKYAKLNPFHVVMRDAADGKTFNNFKTYVASILFSREIRKRTSSESKYVGVLLPNCTTAVLSIMGTLLADKVPCPLNFTTSQEILEKSIHKAKMELVLTSRLFLTKVRLKPTPEMVFLEDIAKCVPGWKKIVAVLGIILLPYKELLTLIAPLTSRDNNGEAVLLFSSGSTGDPKGVKLTHHNIYSDVFAMTQCIAYDIKKDGIFGNLPMFHSFGMNTGLWLPFVMQCRPVVYSHSPLDANLIGDSILKYKCNLLVVTPSFLLTYLRKFKPEVFDVLKAVVSGAEKLRADIAEKFNKAVNGRLSIIEGYGCTELSPVVTVNVSQDVVKTGRECGKKGSIGLGLETVCIRIMDPLTFKPVPPDTEGLLFVKGPMVMQGYLDDPKQTEEVLVNGFYNTGDIAKMDEDGYVTICGRLSRFSKIAGEMVPHELVECIINELCGLENRVVAVASIPDAQKGEALLVLYTPDSPLTPDQIVAELRERSISNLWIPKATNFKLVDKLPILGSGKLDLSLLRKVADQVAQERKAEEAAGNQAQ